MEQKKIYTRPSNMTSTKWRFLKAAIELFAERGYAQVSVRDITEAVDRKQSSIYNHFPSKEDFLAEAFDFYMSHFTASLPSLSDFVNMLDTHKPEEIWDKVHPLCCDDPELTVIMPKILKIALIERLNHPAARTVYDTVFIATQQQYLGALLREMIRRDMIESVDFDTFFMVISSFDVWASLNVGEDIEISLREWREGHRFIFSLLGGQISG